MTLKASLIKILVERCIFHFPLLPVAMVPMVTCATLFGKITRRVWVVYYDCLQSQKNVFFFVPVFLGLFSVGQLGQCGGSDSTCGGDGPAGDFRPRDGRDDAERGAAADGAAAGVAPARDLPTVRKWRSRRSGNAQFEHPVGHSAGPLAAVADTVRAGVPGGCRRGAGKCDLRAERISRERG